MEISQISSVDPDDYARNIQSILGAVKALCEAQSDELPDPHGKALLETTAKVLGGLEEAYIHYLLKDAAAWKEGRDPVIPQKSSDPWD